MSHWIIEESVETTASAEQVWKIWSETSKWPIWDNEIEWVNLDGEFIKGTTGIMKPINGPKTKFKLLEVELNRGFKDRSFLPLTNLDFMHSYIPSTNKTAAKIIHRVEMHGLLTPIFKRVIGKNIKKRLPEAMQTLADLAEKIKP